MGMKVHVDRRRFGRGLAALAALPLVPTLAPRALAGAAVDAETATEAAGAWVELNALTSEAYKMGLSAPRVSLGVATVTDEITEIGPAIVDFMRQVEQDAPETRSLSGADADALLERASELLRKVTQSESSPRELEEDEEDPATRSMRATPYPTIPPLSEIAGEYRELFASCKVRPERERAIDEMVRQMLDPAARARYDKIYVETCIPWFFVAGIHALEASFNFRTHLHNGDSLKAKTYHIPANRPPTWNPPNDWETSAIDALAMKKYDKETSWTLPEICYRWEKYNGVRSRMLHNIHTPYLWSFSQHYTKGKYRADNEWDANYVSQQPGAAVLLRRLVDMGKVKLTGT